MYKRMKKIGLTLALLGVLWVACSSHDGKSGDGQSMPADFVVLVETVPDILQEIRYHSTYNFVGDRIDGYL